MNVAKEVGVCSLLLLLHALASVKGVTPQSNSILCYSSKIGLSPGPAFVDQRTSMQLESDQDSDTDEGCYTAYTVSETPSKRLNSTSLQPLDHQPPNQQEEDSKYATHLYHVSASRRFFPETITCKGSTGCLLMKTPPSSTSHSVTNIGTMTLPSNETVDFSIRFHYTFFVCCCNTNLCNEPATSVEKVAAEYETYIRSHNIDACFIDYNKKGDTSTPRIEHCTKGSMCYTQQAAVGATINVGCAPDDSSIADGECQQNGAEVKCFCRGKLCNSVEHMEPACRRNKDLKSGGGACAVPPTEEQTDPPTTVSTTTQESSLILIISIVAGVVVLLILIALCLIVGVLLWRRRKKAGGKKKDKDAVKKSTRDSKQTSTKDATMAAAKPTAGATKPQDGVAAAVAQKPQNLKEEQIQEPEPNQEKKLEPKPKKDDALVAAADGGELMIDDLPDETKAPIVKDVKMANTPTASSLSEASQSDGTQEK